MNHSQKIAVFHSLHNEAVLISKNLLRDEFLLIECLQKIDEKKVYRFMGFKSLFQYGTIALKLDANRAYTFIQVSRKAAKLAKFQEALKNGLSLSKAKRITSVITTSNEEHWVGLAKTLPQKILERAVCKVNPRSAVEEGTRFISEDTLEFKAAISIDTENLIKRAQDLLCQSSEKPVSFDETLKQMAQIFLEKKDPVRKAQRVLSRRIRTSQKNLILKLNTPTKPPQNLRPSASKNSAQDSRIRKPLMAQLKHQVNLRDQGRCQEPNCSDGRWVDVHHVKAISEGGENILENLITLCRGHHQMEHDTRNLL
jgi:hypothetical protein